MRWAYQKYLRIGSGCAGTKIFEMQEVKLFPSSASMALAYVRSLARLSPDSG
jgi:hypothetical protein